ncbi:MAG: site-specific tyrosine recombinase XerD [Tractidigestivibacter sp.]|uniref:site-specific tyrosine recombinase XerD n=1 Tax=Tractidigestivibacter sp. TaxID=2847320 RepID=UPI003D90CCCE
MSSVESFERLCERFLDYLRHARRLSDNTVRAYKADLKSFSDWARRRGVDPLKATHRQLRGYLAELGRAGYTVRTQDRRLSAVRDLYRWLNREGVIKEDPAAALAMPKGDKRLPKTMSDKDVQSLLATCDASTPEGLRDRAFLELLYASGARISEVSALDVSDVNLTTKQARLFGKGSKERIVPLYDVALKWLSRYLDEARPKLLAMGKGSGRGDPAHALFVSTRGNRMSADALRRVFERHVALAGLDPTLTPHAMRHTYATELVSGGADLRSVQELLGHASLSTTQVYTHVSVERLKEASRQAHPRSGSQS